MDLKKMAEGFLSECSNDESWLDASSQYALWKLEELLARVRRETQKEMSDTTPVDGRRADRLMGTPRPLRDRLRYVVEDMRLRAGQLERDRWYAPDELEARVAENVFAAAVLRQEALRLERMVREDEERPEDPDRPQVSPRPAEGPEAPTNVVQVPADPVASERPSGDGNASRDSTFDTCLSCGTYVGIGGLYCNECAR